MIWYLNSKLGLNFSCTKDFRNLNNFTAQFIKTISHYKKIGYSINVLQQTACLVVDPITVGNFALLFNCTPARRTSDDLKYWSKIFYWPFQGGTSFEDLLCFFLSCVCYAFVRVCLYVPCGHLLGKGWPLGSRLWCLTVSLLLSHWYPGSGVVLDCIDSWSLHPYLL